VIVVSDTSPLTSLIAIGRTEILRRLFGEILVPPAVETELLRFHDSLPDYIQVRPVADVARVAELSACVDPGEAGFFMSADLKERVLKEAGEPL
jgi:predicted nucleic acid-binding protein